MATEKVPVVSLNNPISRRDFTKGMGAIGLLSIVGSALAGCGPRPPEVARTQSLWIKNTEFNGFYAADIKGFYEDEGLKVELLVGGPGIDQQRIVDSKQAEVGLHGSGSSFINSVVGGSRSIMFAAVFQRSPAGLMYLEDNPIATPQDAIGKRIGLQPGATQGWQVICAKNGLDCENDLEIVPVGWDPSPLIDGTVDGYWCYATNQPGIVRLQGYDVGVLDPWEWGFRSYGDFAIVHEDYLKSNRNTVVKWLRASIRGWVYTNDNIEEITQYTVDTFGRDYNLDMVQQVDEATAQIPYMVSDLTENKGLFWFDRQVWYDNIDLLIELGELEPEDAPDVEKMTTFDVLEEVYKDGIDAVYDHGAYVCAPAGRFETVTEIQAFTDLGAHVVGQTVGHVMADALKEVVSNGPGTCNCDSYYLNRLNAFPVPGA